MKKNLIRVEETWLKLNKRIILYFSCLKYPPPEELYRKMEKETRKINICPLGDYDKLRGKVAGYFGITKKSILAGNRSIVVKF